MTRSTYDPRRRVVTTSSATSHLLEGDRAAHTQRRRNQTLTSTGTHSFNVNPNPRVPADLPRAHHEGHGHGVVRHHPQRHHQPTPFSSVNRQPITNPRAGRRTLVPTVFTTTQRIRLTNGPPQPRRPRNAHESEAQAQPTQGERTATPTPTPATSNGRPASSRPVNNYTGPNPVMRAVQNPRLRAVLMGRRINQRRQHTGMQLRMGTRGDPNLQH